MSGVGGRPSSYTPELAQQVLDALAEGELLVDICKRDGMPSQATFFRWRQAHPEFRKAYAQAREEQAEAHAQMAVKVAVKATDPQAARLEYDARKWLASKLDPKNYADKTVLSGDPEAPLIPPDTRRDPAEFLAEWMAKQDGKDA